MSYVNSDSTTVETVEVPALIVGAGAAGARAAIAMQENGVEPLVISKRDHGDAHTTWARGGINASMGNIDDNDSWSVHAADTLEEGHFINDSKAVELVTKNMPDRIEELDRWGMDFTRTDDGSVNQRYFGAQAYPRTCFAGDHTGESLLDTLVDKAQELEIPYRDNVMVTRLLSDGERVYGAAAYDMEDGHYIKFVSKRVVLAAGGSTAIYDRHSSREEENNGDGVGLAYLAGAELMDMEFVQFHPTGMVGYGEEWDGRLVTEAVRGDGGYLLNSEGDRFMFDYSDMDRPELDARDVVARAIFSEVEAGRGTEQGGVHLDISHKDRDYIESRLPRMYNRFQSIGVDIAEEPMEVAPTAHYAMGGVDFDAETGATSVEGLHVIGESTAGVHGANRLGGNSLAETVAIGELVGTHIGELGPDAPLETYVPQNLNTSADEEFTRLDDKLANTGDEDVMELVEELGELLDKNAGIRRSTDRLDTGLNRVERIREQLADVGIQGDITSEEFEFALDLEFMLIAAESVLRGANHRTESRGAHYRDDYPEKSAEQRHNLIYYRSTEGNMSLYERGVNQMNEDVKKAIEEDHQLDYHHLE